MSKPFFLSKTFGGLLIAAIGFILSLQGELSPEDQTTIARFVDELMQVGGLLIAAYGRAVAEGPTSLT